MKFGAQFARVLMALSASTIMTSTVVAPMAFQAHSARSGESGIDVTDTLYGPDPLVLPSTTYNENAQGPETTAGPATSSPATIADNPSDPVSQASSGLYYAPVSVETPPRPALALNTARIAAPSVIMVSLPNITAVKFFIDGAPVALAAIPPWDLYMGTHVDPSNLAAGEHVLRAEVSFASGAVGVREAKFSTLGR